MKTVSLDSLAGGSIEELRREIDVQKSLDHPNIVRLYEYFEDAPQQVRHFLPAAPLSGPSNTRSLCGCTNTFKKRRSM